MSVFTVHEPPLRAARSAADPERFAFVRDGFYFWAFALTPLWMIWHRMWLVLLIYLIVIVGADGAMHYAGIGSGGDVAAGLLLVVAHRVRGGDARRFTLARRGWGDMSALSPATAWRPPSGASSTPGLRRADSAGERPSAASPRAVVCAERAAGVRHYRPVSRTGGAALSIAIVDYGSGNLHSAAKAFERAAHDAGIGEAIVVTNDPEAVVSRRSGGAARRRRVRRLPPRARCGRRHGGRAGGGGTRQGPTVPRHLRRHAIARRTRPRIRGDRRVGLDRRRSRSHYACRPAAENPAHGLEHARVTRPHKLVEGLSLGSEGLHAYFVHSYELKVAQRADLVAEADYGGPLTAIVARDNIVGTQFHPEKSQKLGLAVIANFLKWKP